MNKEIISDVHSVENACDCQGGTILDKCRLLALYLPQFHITPENDRWWGRGFTEWNNVRGARNIYSYDIQPRIPLQGYYDLSNISSIKEQVRLANMYGIDGFIIYSYYFRGERMLEKPLLLLHQHKDISIQYCLSWANHDWTRTWYEFDRSVLKKMEYPKNDKEIMEHFLYCLPFFRDHRYVRWNNRPLFFIYDSTAIPNMQRYREIWNSMAVSYGFDGVCFVQTLGEEVLKRNPNLFDAAFFFEPYYSVFKYHKFQCLRNYILRLIKKALRGKFIATTFSYPKIRKSMERHINSDPCLFSGMVAEWNNTPRHKSNGMILTKFSISEFRKALIAKLKEARDFHKPFIIINAWNEWGEGAFMEPDEYFQYQKLETIKECISVNFRQ